MLRYGALALALCVLACGDDDDGGGAVADAAPSIDVAVLPPDAAAPTIDAAPPDAGAPDANPLSPMTLCATGLYSDCDNEILAPGVVEFAPRYPLWSDGSAKRRFVLLPEGQTIDTSNMDFWDFPVGTKAWKEFTVGGTRVETRLVMRTGPTPDDYFLMAYIWNDAQTEAVATPLGEDNVHGTQHDVPSQNDCAKCHETVPGKLIGLSAIQLSHDGPGLTIADLISNGALSDPPAGPFAIPDDGSGTAEPALGYLHANCGNCHNDTSEVSGTVDARFWLKTANLGTVEDTTIFTTTVDVMHNQFLGPEVTALIEPGMPTASAVRVRMSRRDAVKMPPLGTEIVDDTGLATVDAWITQLGL